MARSYSKTYVAIWTGDFRDLTRDAQHLYFLINSSPKLSPAGMVPVQVRKWSTQSAGATVEGVQTALNELVSKRYLLIDIDTEEALIRTFIRHDRGYVNKFLRKSIESAIPTIESHALREHARLELAACIEDMSASPQVEDSEQGSYQDPSEDASQDTYEGAYEANYILQPQLHPSTSTTASNAGGSQTTAKPAQPNAAAAALNMLIEHKAATANDPTAWKRSMTATIRNENRDALAAYIARRPEATAHELAAHVLHVPGISSGQTEARPSWYADPNCNYCPGDGIRNFAPEGEPGQLAPCPCRAATPHPEPTANIIDFPRKDTA